jgi:predicted DCC family thiol-disulfide oxidoreductase YuxK
VLFDGDCGLCTRSVQFVLARDPRGRFRFAALRSRAAQRLLAGIRPEDLPDSVVLVQHDGVLVKSAAALAIVRGLRWPWPLLSVFWLVPRPVRDWVYDLVARRRRRWFALPARCFVPTPAVRERFLDRDEVDDPRDGA